jgi:serine phosphatase RsbU (regulator of sigma subunit)
MSELNYTVLLCVDYDEKVLRRYNELLKSSESLGGYTQNFGYINKRTLRITQNRIIQYNLILGLGKEDAIDIAQRVDQEKGEIAVAFFDLKSGENDMISTIRAIRKIFPSLICAVAINEKEERHITKPGELFSSPSEWLYFLSDYAPEQMEQLIAHLISSFVLHREKERALAKNEATREGLRQILDASPDLLKNQPEERLAGAILENLRKLTGSANTFLIEYNQSREKFRFIAGTGNFTGEDSFHRLGYDKKTELFEFALSDNKIIRFRDGALAPLVLQAKKVGLLFFDQENLLTRDTELLDVFAHHVAFAIENRKLQMELEHKHAMEHEIELASRIQNSLLPKSFPTIPGIEIYGLTRSAKEIGGDYFDIISSGNNFYFCIGDVSGKGVPAGLIMGELRSIVRAFAMTYNSPRDILLQSAQLLLKDIAGSGKFVSMLLFRWDGKKFLYSSAGHEHILHWHAATGVCDAYRSGGVVLGANFNTFSRVLQERELPLAAGDVMLLFTDGAPEAKNNQKQMFQLTNLQKTVAQYAHLPVQEMIHAILNDILNFIGEVEQHDDITLFGCKVAGKTTLAFKVAKELA